MINETTATSLQKGSLALLVDANAEYDLTNLRKAPEEEVFDDFTEEFFKAEESKKIMIHIETISKTILRCIGQQKYSPHPDVIRVITITLKSFNTLVALMKNFFFLSIYKTIISV